MRLGVFCTACFVVMWALVGIGHSQEGHPLTGAWTGEWGPSTTERTHISLVMEWDGENIGGFVLVGIDPVRIESVALNVTNWTVNFEANGETSSGNSVEIAAEGQLENLGSAHRTITGTWRQGTTEGDFMITRD